MDRIVAARVFVTIAERASLSAAADVRDMSRAMVTRHLAAMENWSGARLFHRTTRRINLTAAGEATLAGVSAAGFHTSLAAKTTRLMDGLNAAARAASVPFATNHVCGMFGLFFSERPVHSFADVMACDVERFKRFFHAMLAEGVYLAPSAFEAGFISAAHSTADIDATIAAAHRAFGKL